jgi:long-chain-fatty-acid--CoA ligase ACSBG
LVPCLATVSLRSPGVVFFARPNDLKDSTLGKRLLVARPTIFFGVPRVWEKFAERLQDLGTKVTGWICCFRKKTVAAWSKRQGLKTATMMQVGGSGRSSTFYGLAEAVVLNPIKFAMGLDECRLFITGAAPTMVDTLSYFGSIGVTLSETFAMSETSGCGIISMDKRHLWGSCGFAAPGTQVKILRQDGTGEVLPCQDIKNPSEEEQGELCFRGRHVMMGYMANPDLGEAHVEETLRQTQEAIDDQGWLHSGDKGCVDVNGMFRVTGRFKELLIGAGGENIAPVPIEDKLKQLCTAISNVIVVGDKMKFNSCLVTLKAKGASGELPGGDELTGPALEVNTDVKTVSAAIEDSQFQAYIEIGIKAVNKDPLACPSNAAKIQKFRILPRDFSIETGEFTSTLKLKRAATAQIWQDTINTMYKD